MVNGFFVLPAVTTITLRNCHRREWQKSVLSSRWCSKIIGRFLSMETTTRAEIVARVWCGTRHDVHNNKSNSRFGESLGTRAGYCADTICTIIIKFSVAPISGDKRLKKNAEQIHNRPDIPSPFSGSTFNTIFLFDLNIRCNLHMSNLNISNFFHSTWIRLLLQCYFHFYTSKFLLKNLYVSNITLQKCLQKKTVMNGQAIQTIAVLDYALGKVTLSSRQITISDFFKRI